MLFVLIAPDHLYTVSQGFRMQQRANQDGTVMCSRQHVMDNDILIFAVFER